MQAESTVRERPALLYDAKCDICRNLAHKIHFNSEKSIDIIALSDPEAHQILGKFYPDGWSHDFYVVKGDTCKKGITALPRLVRTLGPMGMGAAMAEYASYKISRKRCEAKHQHEHGNGNGTSRREFLKYAALSPAALALTQVPRLEEPFNGRPPLEFSVHISEVTPTRSGKYKAEAYACEECVRPAPRLGKVPEGSSSKTVDEQMLRDITMATPSSNGSRAADASFKIRRSTVDTENTEGGRILKTQGTVYNVLLDHPRFNVVVNVGHGPTMAGTDDPKAATIGGLIGHDQPYPVVDFVTVRDAENLDVSSYAEAYRTGIKELRKLHQKEGRKGLAKLYKELEDGLGMIEEQLNGDVPEQLTPVIRNKLVIAATPDMMKFAEFPQRLQFQGDYQAQQSGGGFGCSCGCCLGCCCGCGCGCGCGLCGCSCGCGCCCDCGAGCSCCCGTNIDCV